MLQPRYLLTDTVMAALRKAPVVLIRLYYDATYKDYELQGADGVALQKAMLVLFP